MKKRLQKTLAMLLSLSMVFSLSITAFAEEAPTGAIYEDQVCDYLAYDSTGTPGEATNEYVKSIENGDITMEKSIVQTGEDAFDITLEVTTEQKFEEIAVPADAAVVVIMDASGSMQFDISGGGYCTTCGKYKADAYAACHGSWESTWADPVKDAETGANHGKSRFALMAESVTSFLDDFTNDSGANRWVSMVTYNHDAKVYLDWTDVSTKNGLAAAKAKVAAGELEKLTAGDTNTARAMHVAGEQLTKLSEEVDELFVIVLTDGAPWDTYRYTAANPNGEFLNDGYDADFTTLASMRMKAHAKKPEVYTVSFGKHSGTFNAKWQIIGDLNDYTDDYRVEDNEYLTTSKTYVIDDMMRSWATDADHFFRAEDGVDLTLNLETILETTVGGAEVYTVTDPMAEYINFVQLADSNKKATFEDNTLKWNLIQETPAFDKSSGIYTYSLTYSITLDPEAAGGVIYPTNEATTLKYLDAENAKKDNVVAADIETAYFNVPQVTKGKSHNAITMLEDDQKTEVPVGKDAENLILPTEQGTMTAQKWGTFATDADAEQGIVNVSFDIAGKALEVPGPLDLIVIADESGSLNMYGRADVKANVNSPTTSASYMPCLNDSHYYMVKGLQYELNQIAGLRGLTIPMGTENAAADAATFITPHGVAADGVDLAYTVFGHWGKHPALVRTMIAKAGVTIPEGMTDDDVFRALFSDWDTVALNSKTNKLTFTNLVGWTPDKNHYHKADIDSEIPYVENNETVKETGEPYSYWSPAADNTYGCYDRMMIEKEGVADLVKKIYGQHWDNRVAYVGFTYSAYPSLSSNNVTGADSGFCAATNINYAAGGDAPAALMEVIDNTSGHDYTNYAHALWTAKKMIDDRADKTRPVYVVFISDGVPTRTSSATANTWNILEAPVQGGSDGDCLGFNEIYYGETDYSHETAAMYVAAQFRAFLKETVAEYEFYTVGFNTNASADALLDDMDNNGFYDCADTAAFLKAMEGIRQDIIMVDPDGVLYDEIGADFDFIIDEQHPLIVTAKEYSAENAKWELTTATYTSLEAAEEDNRLTFTYVDGKVTAVSVALEDVTTAEVSFYEQLKSELLKPAVTFSAPYAAYYYETNETDATLTYHKLVLDKTAAIGYKAEENATVVGMKTPWVKVEGYYQSIEDINAGTTLADILDAYRNPVVNAVTVLCDCDPEHDCCDHTEEVSSAAVFSLARSVSATKQADEDEIVETKGKNNGKNTGKGQTKHNAQNNKHGNKHDDCDHKHHKGDCKDEFEKVIVCKCKCKECHQNKFDAPDKKDDKPGKQDNKDIRDQAHKGETGKKNGKKR